MSGTRFTLFKPDKPQVGLDEYALYDYTSGDITIVSLGELKELLAMLQEARGRIDEW